VGGRTTPWPWGGLATPISQNPFFSFSSSSSFFLWPFGGGRTTPLAMGVVQPPLHSLSFFFFFFFKKNNFKKINILMGQNGMF
jgi:hypothetical protein